ncbi:MAG TPA: DUF1294 domain-containing protein [Caldilineae bacterium]|nr:DUF1294 domain-containing protein [Caldilineae bacterium]
MSKRSPKFTFGAIAILLAVGGFIALLIFQNVLPPYISWLVAWTVVTFALYGYDKMEAKLGGGRVPEIVLHGAALAGGFIGGWLGMFVFNHKRRKSVFWAVLSLATILHGVIFYMLFVAK